MTRANGKRAALESWQVESLRASYFISSTDLKIDAEAAWKSVVGEAPETSTSKPKERISVVEGPFDKGRLVLQIQHNRIDWVFHVDANRESDGSPWIGPIDESMRSFTDRMHAWQKFSPIAKRLALGCDLLLPVKSRQEGYSILSSYLNFDLDPEGSSDFQFQINRPRPAPESLPEGLSVNRLSKWSVVEFKMMFLRAGGESISPASPVQNIATAARLTLDINTSATYQGEFSNEQQTKVIDHLVELCREIALEGDVK